MEGYNIFYSWQSNDKKARNYITSCIDKAVEYVNGNTEGIITTIDRDTKGEMGSPNIPKTIEGKIEKCDVFIADLSVVHRIDAVNLLNQNVMYELGYAIAKLGDANCILLHNSDSCEPKDLPFDIAQRRLLMYSAKANNLTDKLLEVLPLYVENASLKKKVPKTPEVLSYWEILILRLFKSIEGEKRLITSKAGDIRFVFYSKYDTSIEEEIQKHNDAQEIRAAFTDLTEKRYLELTISDRGTHSFRLLQKGYSYINKEL